jgi:hypothetical protein
MSLSHGIAEGRVVLNDRNQWCFRHAISGSPFEPAPRQPLATSLCPQNGFFVPVPSLSWSSTTTRTFEPPSDACYERSGLMFGASIPGFLKANPSDGPTCLVLDVRLPGQSGLDLQRELAAAETENSYHLNNRARRHSDVGASDEGGPLSSSRSHFETRTSLTPFKSVSRAIAVVVKTKDCWSLLRSASGR